MISESKKTLTILIGGMVLVFSVLYFLANHLNQSSSLVDIGCLILFISSIGIIKINPQAIIVVIGFSLLGILYFISDVAHWIEIIYYTDQIHLLPHVSKFEFLLERISISLGMLTILVFVVLFLGNVLLTVGNEE